MSPPDARPAVLALGSVNVDLQVRTDRWPEPSETLFGRDFAMLGGGKAGNVALFCRRVGVDAVLIARVGGDSLTAIALAELRRSEVDLTHTREVAHAMTGIAMISVRDDGDKTIILAPNANLDWNDADADDAVAAVQAAAAGSVLVADLEIPTAVVERAAQAAHDRGIKIVLDPSPAQRMTARLHRLADVLTPNIAEASQMTETKIETATQAQQAAVTLQRRGTAVVALKLANGDCVLRDHDQLHCLRSPPVQAVDTTGAGDAYAAAMAVALFENKTPREAALFAMAASSIAVGTYGSQPAYPDRAALDSRYAELQKANRQ